MAFTQAAAQFVMVASVEGWRRRFERFRAKRAKVA
jgi:hypothetical protein